nr:nucleotidyltransferase family protein [Anaerolineales bacterium]
MLCWAKVSDRALTSTLGPDDWRLLAAAAQREGVAPLLYHTLKEQKSQGARELRSAGAGEISPQHLSSSAPLPVLSLVEGLPCPPACPEPRRRAPLPRVPPDVQADLRQAYYATTARNLLLYRELSRILTALNTQYPTSNLQPPTSNLQ